MNKRLTLKQRRLKHTWLKFLLTFLGNTAGIWLIYLAVLFFNGITNVSLPDPISFINDGSLLIISFSFLTSVFITTYNIHILNNLNILAILGILVTLILYGKFVGSGDHFTKAGEISISLIIPLLFSIALLFCSFHYRKRLFFKHSWLKNTKSSGKEYQIFISFAMSGNNKEKNDIINSLIDNLETKLAELGYTNFFDARKTFEGGQAAQPPAEAAKEDFVAIENSKNFLLVYPYQAASSVLIELGYALRDGANIVIVKKKDARLPFLARELNAVNNNQVTIVQYTNEADLLKKLSENHHKYFV